MRVQLQAGAVVGLAVLPWLSWAAPEARADQFLGEEDGVGDQTETPPSEPAEKEKAPSRPRSSGGGQSSAGAVSFSGGLGAGDGYLNAQITVGYSINRWVGVDSTVYYYQMSGNSSSGEEYGPEFDLVLRGANPTIVTPFVGAGPGYLKWSRVYQGKVFDASGAVTANGFFGLDVALTRHFGIQVERKQVTFVGTAPKSFDDQTTPEPKSSVSTIIGFRASL